MQEINDTIRAAVKIQGLPERVELGSWEDVLKALTEYLVVEIPKSATGVIYSSKEPSKDEREKIWIRSDGSGGSTQEYRYVRGKWQPAYDIHPDVITWVYGDSENPPTGFEAILDGDGRIPSTDVNNLPQFLLLL